MEEEPFKVVLDNFGTKKGLKFDFKVKATTTALETKSGKETKSPVHQWGHYKMVQTFQKTIFSSFFEN